uniref:Homeobox protein pal-1 n=1 Tax=Caenorhabditis japonica TaxID=281687 RepID=A0A8R1HL45_CAEJA
MSIDMKSDMSENEPTPDSSPTARLIEPEFKHSHHEWTNYPILPFWNPQPLKDKMLQSSFDPHLYGRWSSQMGDAASFYNHSEFYPFGLPASGQLPTDTSDREVKPQFSSNSAASSDSGVSMYPTDIAPFPSTSAVNSSSSSSSALAAANYAAATCYQQSVWPFMDYQQQLSWKMPLAKERKGLGVTGKTVPTGPGTNNFRVRTADKYRMVYSDYQRLELEKEFHTSPFVNADRKTQLSTLLSLTERQIKIWFQNRRAKDRRDKQKVRL